MHILHLIRRRFPTHYRQIALTLLVLSSAALLAGIGIWLAARP